MTDQTMTDEVFISYCESHSETPRAGFVPEHIGRILRLAGAVKEAEKWENALLQIISIYADDMHPICAKARVALAENTE